MSGMVFGISHVDRFDAPSNPVVFGIETDGSGRSRVSTGDGSGLTGSEAVRPTPTTATGDEQR
ncbi:hypothetical protein ACIBI3_03120 [Actinomadura luteofluorescens]|uniref:hypothetical protein n=1 Tax=Actinomadura luteofluorescens TaxID=46163 RepID=UPI003495A6DD